MGFKAREFYLVEPFRFEEREKEIKEVPQGMLLLRPMLCGICGSEILYYKGQKSEKKLRERLPMALLHEGVCKVVEAGEGAKVEKGALVIPIPFLACRECAACKAGLPANFCQKSRYMGATADGMARTLFLHPESRVVKLEEGVRLEAAALAEPASIALNAVEEAGLKGSERVAVIGDGPVGYLVALMVSVAGKIPKERLFFVGIVDEKLALAKDFAQAVNSREQGERLQGLEQGLDVVFEAAGGRAQETTIGQAIGLLRPKGQLVVLGLSHEKVPVKMVDLVNKGLVLKGVVRSNEAHYKRLAQLLGDSAFQEKLARVAGKKRFKVKTAADLKEAFEFADKEATSGKTAGRTMVEFE